MSKVHIVMKNVLSNSVVNQSVIDGVFSSTTKASGHMDEVQEAYAAGGWTYRTYLSCIYIGMCHEFKLHDHVHTFRVQSEKIT